MTAAKKPKPPFTPRHGRSHVQGHVPVCICGAHGELCEGWDSYYCPKSMVWLEEACDGPCHVCKDRPEQMEMWP